VEIFDIFFGPHSHPSAPTDVKFCAVKRTQVPVGTAKFDLNRFNESRLRGEKPDFWSVSKNNTGSLSTAQIADLGGSGLGLVSRVGGGDRELEAITDLSVERRAQSQDASPLVDVQQ